MRALYKVYIYKFHEYERKRERVGGEEYIRWALVAEEGENSDKAITVDLCPEGKVYLTNSRGIISEKTFS